MSASFEELDRRATPMGEISLRRRLEPSLQIDVYEVKLDDEFLMSSLFTVTEVELARLALAALPTGDLDVVVGGLGLGYTARAVLEDARVRSLHVVEAIPEVIAWHEGGLLPLSAELTSDPRCHLVHGDFFAMVATGAPFGGGAHDADAIVVDIDHAPRHHLHPSHAPFYQPDGLRRLAARIRPGGVFALWSDDSPDAAFTAALEDAFSSAEARMVAFSSPYIQSDAASTVYVATTPPRTLLSARRGR